MIDTNRQTEKQGTDRLTEKNRPTEIQWDRQTKKETEGQKDKKRQRYKDRDRDTNTETEIQKENETDRLKDRQAPETKMQRNKDSHK